MGILNSHQLLAGARRFNVNEPYVIGGFVSQPAVSIDGTTTTLLKVATGSQIEFDGFTVNAGAVSFDFSTLPNVQPSTQYLVAAVPAYYEPLDQTTATGLGLNYYVYNNQLQETVLVPFINPTLETQVAAAGGYAVLEQAVYNGTATTAQQNLLSAYDDAIQHSSDPRYVGRMLPIRTDTYGLVIAQVQPQSNASSQDATVGMTAANFAALKARVNLYRQKLSYTRAAAITKYETGAITFKIYKAYGYTSQANQLAQIGAVPVDLSQATPFTSSSAGLTYFEVVEYYYPSFMPLGEQGNRPALVNLFTNKELSTLGRLDTIYFGGNFDSSRLNRYQRARLTKLADPVLLCEVVTSSAVNGSGIPTSVSLVSGVSYEGLVPNTGANPPFPW